ncbi:heme exporter protein CcmB [Marinomonas mediterranea]|jgi:heme exporter protein CcmB|uniref:Heme exporter protein B n=1 Tax=Marinomonas mediterranea (strain ATCC 700492 / JCM 21426 / NBRC 103028 / MMB-1) TaxID=717774 RepID=F2K3I0_MARM1|nr:heme exporter protein CcmB [Marinomonas mediterranea]ADZ92419.1 heme exporter protein CcmB [Marinomonas mediterranea MMB-1]WCN18470.1 heme exporter protein CcmB [Marinomonas mediterranea MMB-1]
MTYFSVLQAECRLALRRKQDIANSLLFFVVVIMLFPIGVSASPSFLAPASSGIIWCAACLASMLALDGIFREDLSDGSIDQWRINGLMVAFVVLGKVLIRWVTFIVPLLVLVPFCGFALSLPPSLMLDTIFSLLVGTPTLFLLAAIGASVTATLRNGAVLMILIVVPLYLPVLIFSTGYVKASDLGVPGNGQIALLLAFLLVTLVLSPFFCSVSLKASAE